MTIRLRDLQACFEGVIPSIIATASQDGVPNISYLSHVALVDDEHVALSDQFFSKTAANIRANNNAAVMLVDPRDGSQYRLSVIFERSLDSGALFEIMAAELRASSAQLGMADVMRLRGVDIYRVASVEAISSPGAAIATSSPMTSLYLVAAATLCGRISEAREIDAIVDALLDGLRDSFGCANSVLLVKYPAGERLVTVGSRGYSWTDGASYDRGRRLARSAFSRKQGASRFPEGPRNDSLDPGKQRGGSPCACRQYQW